MRYRKLLLSGAVVLCGNLFAIEDFVHEVSPAQPVPWLTGPLLAPSGTTVPVGHLNFEPYLYYTIYKGRYDEHWHVETGPNFYSTNVQFQFQTGIAKGVSFQFYPQFFYNTTQGEHYGNIGDLPFALNIQLYRTTMEDPWPSVKISLRANTPIGKYQHLKRHLKLTDAIGVGSWFPGAALVFSKLWHLKGAHFFEARLAFNYQFGTPVHVKGNNIYGGGKNTRGTVRPGNQLSVDFAIQYSFTQKWAFACDLYYAHSDRNRFSGRVGTLPDGTSARMTAPSGEQWSLAPAIEYNWTENLGIIAGSWFTFTGRNATRFNSPVVAVNIYF